MDPIKFQRFLAIAVLVQKDKNWFFRSVYLTSLFCDKKSMASHVNFQTPLHLCS